MTKPIAGQLTLARTTPGGVTEKLVEGNAAFRNSMLSWLLNIFGSNQSPVQQTPYVFMFPWKAREPYAETDILRHTFFGNNSGDAITYPGWPGVRISNADYLKFR